MMQRTCYFMFLPTTCSIEDLVQLQMKNFEIELCSDLIILDIRIWENWSWISCDKGFQAWSCFDSKWGWMRKKKKN